MRIHLLIGSLSALIVSACGGGEITRGDIYSACVKGHMSDFDTKMDMVIQLATDDEKQETQRVWRGERAKETTAAEKACACSADTLPNRIESDRLSKVVAFYKAQGTMGANGKFNALTESEQTEVTKCLAQVQLDRMKREGWVD